MFSDYSYLTHRYKSFFVTQVGSELERQQVEVLKKIRERVADENPMEEGEGDGCNGNFVGDGSNEGS